MTIGSTPTASQFWDGRLDDLSIWNRTLNNSEITDVCTNGIQGAPEEAVIIPTLYSTSYLNETNWFNTEQFNPNDIEGVLLLMFVFFVIVGLVILTECSEVPAYAVLTGIVIFFYGWLVFTLVSVILGIIVTIVGVFYGLRSMTFM